MVNYLCMLFVLIVGPEESFTNMYEWRNVG
jgi:hypothetical protein